MTSDEPSTVPKPQTSGWLDAQDVAETVVRNEILNGFLQVHVPSGTWALVQSPMRVRFNISVKI